MDKLLRAIIRAAFCLVQFAFAVPVHAVDCKWIDTVGEAAVENITPEEFHRSRVEYHQGIEEDFYRNFKVEGESIYKVRQGDTIWLICNRHVEMPQWLIKKHNPTKDFTALAAGEEIVIPVVEARFSEDALDN